MTKKTIYEQIEKVSLTNDERGKYGDGFEDAVNQLREAIKVQKESEPKNLFFLGIKKGTVRTTFNLALKSLEDENEIPKDFDIIYSIEESEDDKVRIKVNYTNAYEDYPNYIDGMLESYQREYFWAIDYIFLGNYANEIENFETIKSLIREYAHEFADNTLNK